MIGDENVRPLIVDGPKDATSPGPFGTVAGVQLAAVFQSPLLGLALQVALPANEWAALKNKKADTMGKSLFIAQSQQKSAVISRQTELAVWTAGAKKAGADESHRDQANEEVRGRMVCL